MFHYLYMKITRATRKLPEDTVTMLASIPNKNLIWFVMKMSERGKLNEHTLVAYTSEFKIPRELTRMSWQPKATCSLTSCIQ